MYYYYVAMHGVYMQEVSFITEDIGLAKDRAVQLAKDDHDDYHDWNVYIYHRETNESHHYFQYNKNKGFRYILPGEKWTDWVKFS